MFTDVECGYCRKLHSQIDQLTKLGIKVRYAVRSAPGPGHPSWHKMEQVWCSKDRDDALITQAKLGQLVQTPNCGATPVGKQFQLGEDLGVRGTPAIFTRDGDYIGGLPRRPTSWSSRSKNPKRKRRKARVSPEARAFARASGLQRSSSFTLSGLPSHSLASGGAAFFSVITGQALASSAFS